MKQIRKCIGSLLLSVCMIVTMLPTVAFAEEDVPDSEMPSSVTEITAFADLEEDVALQEVTKGTTLEELNLPTTLTATVTTNSTLTTTVSGDEVAMESEAQQLEAQQEETTVAVSEWTSAPTYDRETAGDYIFTPTLDISEGVTVEQGVISPKITVTVVEPAPPIVRESGIQPLSTSEITAFVDLAEDIALQKVVIGTTLDELIVPSALIATVIKDSAITVNVSDWNAEPDYNSDTEGTFIFMPTLDIPEGITVATGVTPPQIKVTVDKSSTSISNEDTALLQTAPSIMTAFATGLQSVDVGAFTLSTDDAEGLIENTDYTYADGVLSLNTNKAVTIANIDPNTPTTDRIKAPGNFDITLNGVDINSPNNHSAISVCGSGILTLADGSINTLAGNAGILAIDNVIITGTGSLTANSNGEYGGIASLGNHELIINGGTIIANGNGGYSGSAGICGEEIIISGSAHVTATGGGASAGIGSNARVGSIRRNTDITIADNATVIAVGADYAAGIGGGIRSDTTAVTISSGHISAIGGKNASGIGSGYDGQSTTITITGGEFAQGDTATQTVCGATVSGNYYVADNGGNTDYPYIVQEVTDMLVAPSAVTVQKGKTQQFTAKGASSAVTWLVAATSGIKADGTTISDSGLLTVAADESASALTVTGTATEGGSSANATVAVIEPYVTVSFNNGYGSGTAAPVKVTKTGNAFTYTLPNVGNGEGEINFTAPTGETFAGWLVGDETTATAAGQSITLTEDVTLTANWAKEPVIYLGGIAIDADSTTTVTGDKYSYIYNADTATGTLTLKGYTNTGTHNDGSCHYALYANFNLVLNLEAGSTNMLAGPNSTGNDAFDSYGILIVGGSLTIEGTGALTASGGVAYDSYGIYADSVSIIGGTVVATATNGTLESNYYCEPLEIELGDLSVTNGGSLTLQNYTPNETNLFNLNGNLTVGEGYVTKVGYSTDGSDAYEIKSDEFDVYEELFNYAEIKADTSTITSGTTFYPIWVGGVQVTSANASNIQEGVSYDHTGKTLTLNNADITAVNTQEGVTLPSQACFAGVYFWGDLTLSLEGNSTITGGSGTDYSYGICVDRNASGGNYALTINGKDSTTLEVNAVTAKMESCGIEIVNGNLTMLGGRVTARGGTVNAIGDIEAKSQGVSMLWDCTFTYSDGILTAIAGTATASEGIETYSVGMDKAPTGGSMLVSDATDTGDMKVVESGKTVADYPYAIVYQPYQIIGTIKGSDTGEIGLVQAQVQLKNDRGNVGSVALTGDDGTYAISSVPAGTYTIEVRKDGYITDTISSFTVSNGHVSGKDITLTKGISGVTITKQPQNVTVQQGGTATFTIEATNATGYQWYCSATENDIPQGGNEIIIDSSGEVSGATTKTLTIHTVTDKMNGEMIQCSVKGSDPSGNIWSDLATLTVTPIPTTVTNVTVSPDIANVQKGTTQQFHAAVCGTGAYNNTVTWTVEGKTNPGTTISDTGLLSVTSDETATVLTVKAISVGDNTKYDTATVTVTDTPVTTQTLTVTNGTGSGDYEAGAVISITANAPIESKQFKNWTATGGGSFVDASSATTTFTMPANPVTITANYEDISSSTYSVVVEGSYASTTGAGSYAKNAMVNIYAGSRSNYSFSGWTVLSGGLTITNANSKNASFTMPDNAVTVKANWSYNGGGSSSGGGGGTSSGGSTTTPTVKPSTPTTENPKPVTEVTMTVKSTISNGIANVTVEQSTVADAIKKAQEQAKKNGNEKNGIAVEIKVDIKNSTACNLSANLPKACVETLVKAGTREVRITSEITDISLNLETLQEIQKQVGTDANVTAKKVDKNTLSANARKLVGNRPVYDFSITGANGTKVIDFGKGKISISIPYTLGENEKAENVTAYYIDNDGNVQEMPNCIYNEKTKTLSFMTEHLSIYAVGYKADAKIAFTDIAKHWAKDDIEFVTVRGLFGGTAQDKFSPNMSMTRGMLVTVLGRLEGVDVSSYTKSSFTDVKAGNAFQPYIEWAYKKGIVQGVGNKQFASNRAITREEIAVIVANFTKATEYTLPVTHEANTYTDDFSIGNIYKTAVTAMQQAGIMMGGTNNKFNPKSNATRAEVSTMLQRYIELNID